MTEKVKRMPMPAIHPSWAMPQASERTPEPIIVVIIWALAVHIIPAFSHALELLKLCFS
jgi:uncharacterized RDD family membrane protein YckC